MKRSLGLILIIVTMVSCLRHATETAYAPSQRLIAIDTLMQTRPDSALTLLLDSTVDDPYYQLLLSEALYKNYYAQTNRAELFDAMAYYDSINEPFLSARCHYMIGVGYYEMDSVVLACQEYMKALEIMEEHFPKKELVGYKAKYVTSHLKYTEDTTSVNSWNSYTCTHIEEMIPVLIKLIMNCYPGTKILPQPNEPACFSYFKYYRLERGDTDTYHPTVFTPSNESTKVYPHIILGGTGCTANITTSTAIWAEQDIVFDKGFEVAAGTSFSARVINVPNPGSSPLYKQNSYY